MAEQGGVKPRSASDTDIILQWNTEEQTIYGFGAVQAGWSEPMELDNAQVIHTM